MNPNSKKCRTRTTTERKDFDIDPKVSIPYNVAMQYKNIVNKLIPADDLHWDEAESRYASLSGEETEEIIMKCLEAGMSEISDINKFVQWCGFVRIGQILMKNFMSGSLKVTGFDHEDMPYFCPKETK